MLFSSNPVEAAAGIGAVALLVFGVLVPSTPKEAMMVLAGVAIGGSCMYCTAKILAWRRKVRGKK
jgi:hypothetical protein